MNQRQIRLFTVITLLIICLSACSSKSQLRIEEHAINAMDWEGDSLIFEPLEGSREAILAKHQVERSKPAITFTPSVTLGGDSLNAMEHYTGNQVSVNVTRNDLLELSIDAGVISPIHNFRGLWMMDDQWFLEVAHVEEDPVDPNAAFIVWGEIFQNGVSLNEKHGYEESFGFQILDGKPFFFFSKDDTLGFSYDGREAFLGYTEIPHYLCCSASAFNPQAADKMVAFYAADGEQDYYIELGVFK